MSITFKQLQTEYKPQILDLAAQYGASNIRVFGSVMRGDSNKASDVDFLIDFQQGRSLTDLCALRLELVDTLGQNVDLVPEPWLRPHIKDKVLAEAQAL